MEVQTTSLQGVLFITPDVYCDARGYNTSIYNGADYRAQGITVPFVEDKVSVSRQNVLRGIHRDPKTWKLITCLFGEIYLAVVNCDETSSNFGVAKGFYLSDDNHQQVLVPPGYGNGHLVLSESAVFHYKWSEYYCPEAQQHYHYADSRFNIPWPVRNYILSERDATPATKKEK